MNGGDYDMDWNKKIILNHNIDYENTIRYLSEVQGVDKEVIVLARQIQFYEINKAFIKGNVKSFYKRFENKCDKCNLISNNPQEDFFKSCIKKAQKMIIIVK